MHLNEEQLVLHYYGEEEDAEATMRHLGRCAACRSELERLRHVLSLVDAEVTPEPPPEFERVVWARLQASLPGQWMPWVSRVLANRPGWVVGGAAAAIVLVFLAGRLSVVNPGVNAPPAEVDTGAGARVLLVELVDHLDRSEVVLLELLNAGDAGGSRLATGQARARDLVAANRLYRQSAARAGDGPTGTLLEDLERVLLEVANAPAETTVRDLEALRARIASEGLLFRVRVVQSSVRERQRQRVLDISSG
jgi:hypothetical protein